MLTLTEDSLTVSEADAYAASRGRAVWTDKPSSPPTEKEAAIRRAIDFMAGTYNDRWLVEFDPDDAPDGVKFAIAEAAIREIEEPGALLPDLDSNGRIKSMSAGSVNITYADGVTLQSVFQGIENLLVAAGLIKARSSTMSSFYARA
ncbi:MAG: hypothetical protein WA975_18230 [Mesorhizobium sp.]